MSDNEFSIGDPAMKAVLHDVPTMQRWEIIRRAQRPMSVAELAAAARASIKDVQRSLDLLVDARIAVRTPAGNGRREITYRATVERLVVSWDKTKPAEVAAERDMRMHARRYSRKVQDEALAKLDTEMLLSGGLEGVTSVMLLREDQSKVKRALAGIYLMLAEADARARASGAEFDARPFHFYVGLTLLPEPELPMAEVLGCEVSNLPATRHRLVSSARAVLSPRELQVAELLAEGRSRPAIAKELGLTYNTVSSLGKLIYKKLGVRSRAELSGRVRAH
jgi:DNA-binding CsgD family transcriptional regulator